METVRHHDHGIGAGVNRAGLGVSGAAGVVGFPFTIQVFLFTIQLQYWVNLFGSMETFKIMLRFSLNIKYLFTSIIHSCVLCLKAASRENKTIKAC